MRIDIVTTEPEHPAIAGFIYTDLDGTATEEELAREAFADMRADYAEHVVSAGFSDDWTRRSLVVEVFELPTALAATA